MSILIRTNAISSTKVASNSLTGADILESSLGPVPKVTGLNDVPLTRAVATAGANEATARAAAPEIPLLTRGQVSVYGKCLKDGAVNQVRAEIFVRTAADGAVLQGGVTLDGGNGSLFLNIATPEINRRTDSEVAAVNAASAASNGFVAIAPDGTAIRSLLYSGAKNGTLAGPAGQGLYGAGDGCLFGGFVGRVGSGDGPRVGYSAGSGRCRIAFVRERRAF